MGREEIIISNDDAAVAETSAVLIDSGFCGMNWFFQNLRTLFSLLFQLSLTVGGDGAGAG